jgi:hypothetical protein
MGVVSAYGHIARAATSREPRQRRAGLALLLAISLPAFLLLFAAGLVLIVQ